MSSKRMWEIKNAVANALDLYIYSEVDSYGHFNYSDWSYEESKTSADYFRKELAEHPGIEQINIYINCPGGDVFEGTAIYNILKRHSAHKTVYVDGRAASIASVIAMAGDEIVMPRNTLMMVHNMWMCCCGNASELRKFADDLDVINDTGKEAYLLKAGDKLSFEELTRLMDEETWLSAEKCIELGLADRFADEDAPVDNVEKMLQQAKVGANQKLRNIAALNKQIKELIENAPKMSEKTPDLGTIDTNKGNNTTPPKNNAVLNFFANMKG